MVVPGHCLAQASREFLQLYPTARILVADETNFVKDKRQRFLARAATAQWDCIIITHSAFKFIPAPAEFERELIADQIQSYSDLLERVDGADRLSRKRIERMKEGLEEDLDRLKSHKDDMLTIAEIGVDQLIVDEMQEFRKLSFATNQTTLKGIDPEGSQRAWDLYVKVRFIDCDEESGTSADRGLGDADHQFARRTLHRAALRPAGRPYGARHPAVRRLGGQFRRDEDRARAPAVRPLQAGHPILRVRQCPRPDGDLSDGDRRRPQVRPPPISEVAGDRGRASADRRRAGRARPSSPISAISPSGSRRSKNRQRKPQKGDDILLSVITDGRHAAIDLRFVQSRSDNEPDNKLNALIDNVHRIWEQTANNRYTRADGVPYALPGAAQMIFSDLGTLAAEETRGFSAYRWIKDSLVARGVPAAQIAFMQDYKKSSAKQRLFNAVNGGQVRILIGSSRDHGHRRERPATPQSPASSRRAVAALADRAARGSDRAPGQRERRDRALRLRDQAQRRRHGMADPRTQSPLHRRGHVRRPLRPPDRGRRLAGEPVRPRQGHRVRRRTADAQGRRRRRNRPARAPARQPFRRPVRHQAQDRFRRTKARRRDPPD